MNRSRLAVALGVVVLLLGSCSDDPRPKVAPATHAPTVTDTPSPSVHSSATSPRSAFRSWIESRNEALSTGDTTAVRGLSSEDCRSCDGLIAPIEKIYQAGGHFHTDGWAVVKAKLRKVDTKIAVIDAGITMAAGETVSELGKVPVRYRAEKHIVVCKLRPSDDGWVVTFLGFLS